MPKYKIPVIYQMYGYYEIEADSQHEANEKVFETGRGLPANGSYIDDSMEIDKESSHYGRVVIPTDQPMTTDELLEKLSEPDIEGENVEVYLVLGAGFRSTHIFSRNGDEIFHRALIDDSEEETTVQEFREQYKEHEGKKIWNGFELN